MSYLFCTLSVLSYLILLASVFFVFKKVESTNNIRYRIFQVQFHVTWGCFFYAFYSAEVLHETALAISSAMIVACLGLFFYCTTLIRRNKLSIVFSEDSPEFHISKGPYAYIRHPFYASYIFTYVALVIAVPNVIVAIPACAMFFTYFTAAKYEEQKFMNSNLREAYSNYMQSTGMFYPKIFGRNKSARPEELKAS